MKKLSLILLLFSYALATMGFSTKAFYCCGTLKSVSVDVFASQKHHCGSIDIKNDGCCKDKFQYFKVKDNHLSYAQISSSGKQLVPFHLPFTLFLQNSGFSRQSHAIAYQSNAPPAGIGVPHYIYNCVFRI